MKRLDRSCAQPLWRRYSRFLRPNAAADVEDEFNFHLEMLREGNLARGMPP